MTPTRVDGDIVGLPSLFFYFFFIEFPRNVHAGLPVLSLFIT